ncbi:V-type proton ATPase subunit S1 [Dendroctonus ponderosae]|uniref:Vacuolar ATP synthase subunit S1 n=1 Tax=Dendroctonus ponderosae TaxID=77166 RepID=U4UAV2_DENPD|nr:V-type proton ATPase subunit S1 [Dendroctonus ponderosae]ERL90187.1 hypothetical protein D910_07541 [Dendroctonus ponderosae]KAH1017585.1 hypothetical protein HUJ05_008201 [Dendroctonus ponderosae]
MHIKRTALCVFLKILSLNAAIIVWSNKRVEVSPLLPFDDDDLEKLASKLEVKNVFLFRVALKTSTAPIPKNLREVIEPYHSSYNPNGNIATANATELSLLDDCNGITTQLKIKEKVGNATDFLCVLDVTYPRIRSKRAADDQEATNRTQAEVKGPVIYISETDLSKKNNQYALLYSSKPLKLEVNNSVKYLGNTDNSLITLSKRFNIPVLLGTEEKVYLRFGISWINGYWYMQTVKVELTGESEGKPSYYTLTTDENILAPAHFSYHCNGQSVFSDPTTGTKLTIYDLQVQIDAKKPKFGDANDCVPFTTAPIWSGLFVTTILGLGLIVALTALMDIKTMDKFDNQATKNLGITVMD